LTLLNAFLSIVGSSVDSAAILNTARFGIFTANFKELHSLPPQGYLTESIGFVPATVLGALLIPSSIMMSKSRGMYEIRSSS
jgi:hypothetical protein